MKAPHVSGVLLASLVGLVLVTACGKTGGVEKEPRDGGTPSDGGVTPVSEGGADALPDVTPETDVAPGPAAREFVDGLLTTLCAWARCPDGFPDKPCEQVPPVQAVTYGGLALESAVAAGSVSLDIAKARACIAELEKHTAVRWHSATGVTTAPRSALLWALPAPPVPWVATRTWRTIVPTGTPARANQSAAFAPRWKGNRAPTPSASRPSCATTASV